MVSLEAIDSMLGVGLHSPRVGIPKSDSGNTPENKFPEISKVSDRVQYRQD
jgi:hypothetical protein